MNDEILLLSIWMSNWFKWSQGWGVVCRAWHDLMCSHVEMLTGPSLLRLTTTRPGRRQPGPGGDVPHTPLQLIIFSLILYEYFHNLSAQIQPHVFIGCFIMSCNGDSYLTYRIEILYIELVFFPYSSLLSGHPRSLDILSPITETFCCRR